MTPVRSAAPILVVDDDPKIVALVRTYLEREGFPVVSAADGKAALASFADDAMPRLIVLDIMLPELDGLALMRIVRERSEVPIILLSARASTADRVYGIHEGADDYVVKPFSPAELVVRVKAVLRRSEGAARTPKQPSSLSFADLSIDLDRFEVRRGSRRLSLTAAEFKLLTALAGADGRVLSRQALLDALYGPVQGDALERTIDVHIRRLREKLDDPVDNPRYIATVRGMGYRTVETPSLPSLRSAGLSAEDE
jgi:DNA-binding response OmpR family regulator